MKISQLVKKHGDDWATKLPNAWQHYRQSVRDYRFMRLPIGCRLPAAQRNKLIMVQS